MEFDLKSLDSDSKFERLCNSLLIKQNPKLKAIDGRGGDNGIDSLIGEVSGEIEIFQSKYFTGRIGGSERRKILESLETAKKKNPGMKRWTLLVATDFTVDEEKWFETEVVKKNDGLAIDYWNKTKIASEIAKYDEIQDIYFNKATLVAAKKIEQAVPFLTGSPISKIHGVSEYLDKLKKQHPGLGLEYSIDSKEQTTKLTINPTAKPVEFDLQTKIKVEKLGGMTDFRELLNDMYRTGKSITLLEDEILGVEFHSEELAGFVPEGFKIREITISPQYTNTRISASLEISNTSIFYDNVELIPTKIDGDNVYIKVSNMPCELVFVVNKIKTNEGSINLSYNMIGKTVSEIFRFECLMDALRLGNRIIIRDKSTKKVIINGTPNLNQNLDVDQFWIDVVKSLYALEQLTEHTFILPEKVTDEEYDALKLAVELLTEKKALRSLRQFKVTIDRDSALKWIEMYEKDGMLKNSIFSLKQLGVRLFGKNVLIGDVRHKLPIMRIDNIEYVKECIAKNSSSVEFVLTPLDPKELDEITVV